MTKKGNGTFHSRTALGRSWARVKTDLFNTSVYNFWYGATFAANPTLETVLNNPQTYSGAPLPGTSGYPLNAFNATGAYLTDNIPGYNFDISVMLAGAATPARSITSAISSSEWVVLRGRDTRLLRQGSPCGGAREGVLE